MVHRYKVVFGRKWIGGEGRVRGLFLELYLSVNRLIRPDGHLLPRCAGERLNGATSKGSIAASNKPASVHHIRQ